MKQNIELLKRILLYVEEHQASSEPIEGVPIFNALVQGGYLMETEEDYKILASHIKLLVDDSLIEENTYHAIGGMRLFMVTRITAEGYRFIENIRDDTFFLRIKRYLDENKLPLTISAIGIAAKALIESAK